MKECVKENVEQNPEGLVSNDLFGNLGFSGGKGGGFPGFPGGFGAGKDGGNGRGGSGRAGGNGNRPLPKIKFKKPGPLGIAIGVCLLYTSDAADE